MTSMLGSGTSGSYRATPTLTVTGRPISENDEPLDRLPVTLARGQGQVTVGAGEDDDELLAAIAAEVVLGAEARLERPGDRLQHDVPDLVSERVVDLLEVVDVEEEHRELPRRGQEALEGRANRSTVGDACERVDDGFAPVRVALLAEPGEAVALALVPQLDAHASLELSDAVVDGEEVVGAAEQPRATSSSAFAAVVTMRMGTPRPRSVARSSLHTSNAEGIGKADDRR